MKAWIINWFVGLVRPLFSKAVLKEEFQHGYIHGLMDARKYGWREFLPDTEDAGIADYATCYSYERGRFAIGKRPSSHE